MAELLNISDVTKDEKISYLLLADFKLFCRYFFRLIFHAEFEDREHVTLIQDELLRVASGEIQFLNINVHPGSFKSTLLTLFISWCIARDSRAAFVYTSYTFDLAEKQTANIFRIVSHSQFKTLFNVSIDPLSGSKSNFLTDKRGGVVAAGLTGSITGYDAGRPFEGSGVLLGANIIDDSMKPYDAHSSARRAEVRRVYFETIMSRGRNLRTPILSISQRTHEDDLTKVFLNNEDGNKWHHLILPFLKSDGTVLDPKIKSKETFLAMLKNPNTSFAAHSQYMQNPVSVGNSLFSSKDFKILPEIPDFTRIFITGDVAETDNRKNDATAFSCWGIFDVKYAGYTSGQKALVWLDCIEIWVKPTELVNSFMGFYSKNMATYGKVDFVAIENKSMGVMLNSFLYQQPALVCSPIIRQNKLSKMDRIARAEPKVRAGLICLLEDAQHNDLVLGHMGKISPSCSHSRDDIADTLADAVNLTYFDGCEGMYRPDDTEINKDIREFTDSLKAPLNKRGIALNEDLSKYF